ncbi:Belongs to the serpin [Sparganum proliferum]
MTSKDSVESEPLTSTSRCFVSCHPICISVGVDHFLPFTQSIYAILYHSDSGCVANCFISPLSIYSVLCQLLVGSEGNTRAEILRILKLEASEKLDATVDYVCEHITFNSKDGEETCTTQASGIFLQSGLGILDSYSKSVQKHFGTSSIEVDYVNKPDDSRHVINQWIESRTNGKIKELLPDGAISSLTTFVIASAVYFKGGHALYQFKCKGIWKEKFAPAATNSGKFYPLNGQDMNVLMMQSRRKLFFAEFNEELGCRAVHLPFERQEMIIVLPNSNDGLPALLQKLLEPSQGQLFRDIISRDAYHEVEVRLRLPKFRLTKGCSQDLKKTLSALGMPSAFDARKADFSAIAGRRDLFLSAMFHKAVIEVDESGAEAAAATAAVANTRCMPINMPRDFIVDHPFLFFITTDTGLPIFMGHVVEPESNS